MENSYGIGITNRYACFIDDGDEVGDPIDILKQVQNEKKAKKVEVAKPTNAKAPATANKDGIKKTENDNKENRNNQRFEGKRVLDARKSQEGPREERNNKVNQEGGPRREVDDEGRGRGRGGRGGGRGMGGRGRGSEGGPRGGGSGAGAPRGEGFRGKREFERKSGDNKTGVKAEEKRGGGGKGNWGTMEDELKGETEDGNVTLDENAAAAVAPKEDAGEKSGEEGAAEDKPKEEEEPKQMTLDEWKATQTKRQEPKFNLRKAGEGSDIDPKWKKAAAYKKEKDAGEDDEDEDDDQFVYSQRANRLKHINVDLHFADQQASGGRGGRGRGRGRGRGGRAPRDGDIRRGDKSQQFSLDDKNAFPALG